MEEMGEVMSLWENVYTTVPFKSIRPSPVPSLVAVAEIGHFPPVLGTLVGAGR